MDRPLVLVVGGGFAGVEAARTLSRARGCEVLLVDVSNFALFTPMLPEVAIGDIETRHILVPHRDVLPPASYRQGRVLALNLAQRTAVVETKIMPRRDTIHFAHALFSPGSVTSFSGVPGAEDHAFTFKTIGDAVLLRNRILALLERASVEASPEGRDGLCRVVIIGAGYSGVELAAALADFFRSARSRYPELSRHLQVVLVEAQREVTPMLPEKLRGAVQKRLGASGVDLRLGRRVQEVAPEAVILEGGEALPTWTTVWSAGVGPPEDLERWGLPRTAKGKIRVDRCLRVEGSDTAWAAGDAAAVPQEGGGTAPPTAQHAIRQGRHAARNILSVLEGTKPRPYRYRTMGELVSLGHRSGVGRVMGFMVKGFPAWWMWRTYYLFRLPTWFRRIRVALDWTVDLFFPKDIVQLPYRNERDLRERDEAGS